MSISYRKKIIKDRILYFLVYIMINILLFMVFHINSDYQRSLNLLNIISLFQLTISLLILRKFSYTIYSLPVVFLILSYFFHLGQLPLLAFNIDADMPWPVIKLIDPNIYIDSIMFVIKVHFTLVLGILIKSMNRYTEVESSTINSSEQSELNRIFVIGKIFVIIGVFPLLYYEAKKFFAYITIGYGSTGIAPLGVISLIMNMFYIGLIMMLIGKKNDYKYSRNLLLTSIFLFVLMMVSGSRGEKIVRLIIMFSVFFTISYNKRIKIKTWIKYIFSGYLGLTFINFVSDMRSQDFSGYSSFITIFAGALKSNPLFEAMGEFGGTLVSVGYSLTFFPSTSEYLLGSSYIKGLSMMMLNIGGFIDGFRDEILYVFQFPVRYQTALGGSYIGELYANFGQLGVIFSFVIGIFLASISKKIELSCINKQWIRYSMMIVVYSRVIWWIRDYFGNMVREIVWVSLAIIILNEALKKQQRIKHQERFNYKDVGGGK